LLTDNWSSVVEWDIKKYTLQVNISNTDQCMTLDFEKQIIIYINLNTKYEKMLGDCLFVPLCRSNRLSVSWYRFTKHMYYRASGGYLSEKIMLILLINCPSVFMGGGGGGGGGGLAPKRKGLGKQNFEWVKGWVNETQNNSRVG
jgi:hypothetical protein